MKTKLTITCECGRVFTAADFGREMGRRGKGVKKNFTADERARRSAQMFKLNEARRKVLRPDSPG